MMSDATQATITDVLAQLHLPVPPGRVEVTPSEDLFGSPYGVTHAAETAVATALGAIAVLDAVRSGAPPPPVHLDGRHAAILYHSERLLETPGVDGDPLWGTVTGTHRTADGWLRIHANLAPHRRAALEVLGVPGDRTRVEEAVASWEGQALEDAIVAAGGVAAVLRSRDAWRSHPQGRVVAEDPLVTTASGEEGAGLPAGRLLEGVRVLDLTRVIAGPVAGRFLASLGAEVLRIDGPLDDGWRLEIDTSLGKRRVELDLRDRDQRSAFERLLRDADVLIHAFRPGALASLGYDRASLQHHRPGLVDARLSAYGASGPWGERRGFDSVVQVAAGLAHTCAAPDGTPGALPAQALDHSSGYLLAAGIAAALARREVDGVGGGVEVSLARTADWLETLPAAGRPAVAALPASVVAPYLETSSTDAWGDLVHVRAAGRVGDRVATWPSPPVPRGHDRPVWLSQAR
jgi:hypothetical protein